MYQDNNDYHSTSLRVPSELHEWLLAYAKKWRKSGLLKGLNEQKDVLSLGVLYQNQAKQLLKQATRFASARDASTLRYIWKSFITTAWCRIIGTPPCFR